MSDAKIPSLGGWTFCSRIAVLEIQSDFIELATKRVVFGPGFRRRPIILKKLGIHRNVIGYTSESRNCQDDMKSDRSAEVS